MNFRANSGFLRLYGYTDWRPNGPHITLFSLPYVEDPFNPIHIRARVIIRKYFRDIKNVTINGI